MLVALIISLVIAAIIVLLFLTSFVCFYLVFFSRKEAESDGYDLPTGEGYKPYLDSMRGWIDDLRATPCEEISTKSADGLTLYGAYYELNPTSPIEIMFHGYRGTRDRDFCVGVERAQRVGHSAILIDQRAHGKSDGRIISFGIKERLDVLAWVEYVNLHYPNRPIILTGISMGAATVMMASELELPNNVICTLADCGYTSPRDIICKVMRDMRLPARIIYPLVRLGAIAFGGFDPDSASPKRAVANSRVPIIFAHGECDGFVPYQMSIENYNACATEKKLVLVPGAEHGIAYIVDKDSYVESLRSFFEPIEKRYYERKTN